MPNNHKSHKRQKSSISNVGYYFPDSSPSHSPSRLQTHSASGASTTPVLKPDPTLSPSLLSTGMSQPMSSPTHSNPRSVHSPALDQGMYEQDVYNPLNYNFPPQDRSTLFYSAPPSSYSMDQVAFSSASSSNYLPPPPQHQHQSSSSVHTVGPPVGQPFSLQQSMSMPTMPTLPQGSPMAMGGHGPMSAVFSGISTPRTTYASARTSPARRTVRRPSRGLSISTPAGTDISSSKPALALPHHKANLSISSHFNLFSLNEPEEKQYSFNENALFNDLVLNLADIDQPSVNGFLVKMLYKLDNPIPLDDFFNLLYNDQKLIELDTADKIDRTQIASNLSQKCVEILHQILEIFKKPDIIHGLLSNNNISKEVKLSNINYHELLRTFLAIKILQDMLIELPRNSDADLANFNIPRLSLYKTYFIICQKLLLQYPSSLSSSNEHHKLILGQSKLGKLIKLVFPDLLIKRLGSRGESKYNYLGVVWNENIIDSEIAALCNNYELEDLNQIFQAKYKAKFENLISQSGLKSQNLTEVHTGDTSGGRSDAVLSTIASNPSTIMASESFDVEFSKPLYSFLDETLKFPSDFNVSDWIKITKLSLKSDSPEDIDGVVQQLVDSQTGGSDFGSSLVSNLNAIGFNMSEHCNDLKVYLCILLEVFPKMLMIEPSTNLRELKSSLLHFLDDDQFASLNQKNLTNFKLLLKNLIGLNDLLINLVKYVFKDTLIMGDLHHVFDNSNHDNLINSLVDSLIIFDMTESLNYSFLNDNVNNLKAFFLVDLHQFFEATQLATIENSEVKSEEPEFESLTSDFKMTNYEFTSLLKFLSLIDNGLVKNFNQFPIFMMINFLNLVSNDFLKSVYFKHVNSSSSAFSHWWSINCFLQDYVSMVGELYGLYNEIYRIS